MKSERTCRTQIADDLRRQGVEIEMTIDETAVYLNVTPRLVYELVAANQIPVRKIKLPGRKRPILRFSRAALANGATSAQKLQLKSCHGSLHRVTIRPALLRGGNT